MFSSRLHWDVELNRLSRLAQAKRESGTAVLDLTESNPTQAGFSYPADLITSAFDDPGILTYAPAPAGAISARKAVAEHYASRAHAVSADRILLTASTSESYSWLFKLLANPGDEILVPRPSYPLFDFLAALESVRVVHYPLAYHHGWAVDLDALCQAVSPRTRAIVAINPNNPTGSFLKKAELERLVELAAARELAIISDEVFADYFFERDPDRVSTLLDVSEALTFCLSGLSKVAGLPQMKLGWIVAGGPSDLRSRAVQRLELIADTYLSVGTPVQSALARLLDAGAALREQIMDRLRENMAFLKAAMIKAPATRVLEVEGGWYATLHVPRTRSEEEWCLEILDQENVIVQPGFFYDFESEAFLVISLLTQSAIFHDGVARLLQRLER
jgi:aspartate/methionine/tyrosine aminotransferase